MVTMNQLEVGFLTCPHLTLNEHGRPKNGPKMIIELDAHTALCVCSTCASVIRGRVLNDVIGGAIQRGIHNAFRESWKRNA